MSNQKTSVVKRNNSIDRSKSEKGLDRIPEEQKEKSIQEYFESEVAMLIQKAGTLKLTKAQKDILYAGVNPDAVEIRPDGLIYLPWMEYVTRLKKAFDMRWAIVPKGMPKVGPDQRSILWGFYLIIDGRLAGFAIGEQEYYPNNPVMNWSDACEAAKSNALMRLCKGIGIALELWQPSFIEKWKKKYAETYQDRDRRGNDVTRWRKKGEKPKEEPKQKETKPKRSRKAKEESPPQEEKEEHKEARSNKDGDLAKQKETIIKNIKTYLEMKTIDVKRFKLWLGEVFNGMKKRTFVSKNEWGNWSFHSGKLDDLKLMNMYPDHAIDIFIEYEEENPNWHTKFEEEEDRDMPY